VEDNFLTQLVSESTTGGAWLDLLFTNREGLVGDVVVRGCLGLSNHEMMEFSVCGEVKRGASRIGLSEGTLWPLEKAEVLHAFFACL